MRRRRKKPPSVADARAQMDQSDLEAVRKWRGASNDVVVFQVNCVVCGRTNKATVLRFNLAEVEGAKYLCEFCQDNGWAWMGNIQGSGTVIETKDKATVEEQASPDGSYLEANDLLFKSRDKMKSTHQNPNAEYKPIRVFPDDTLLLKLSKCKYPKDIDEAEFWSLWCDKRRS